MSQFVVIRKAFFMKKYVRIEQNFHSVIDLTKRLKDIDCELVDILNLYKIYHNRLTNIDKIDVIKCDKIVKHLGFDKHTSEYYYNSRKHIKLIKFDNCLNHHETQPSMSPSYKLPKGALAIYELRIYVTENQAEPKEIKLKFEMPHYQGWF